MHDFIPGDQPGEKLLVDVGSSIVIYELVTPAYSRDQFRIFGKHTADLIDIMYQKLLELCDAQRTSKSPSLHGGLAESLAEFDRLPRGAQVMMVPYLKEPLEYLVALQPINLRNQIQDSATQYVH